MNEKKQEVLYGDCNGHMRPLSRMYFSLDSRCLVADHPESVQEEVESHFCPHCNSLCTTPEAQLHGNRCLQCYECPCCGCVLSTSPVSLESLSAAAAATTSTSAPASYSLQCFYCQWTSEDHSSLVAREPAGLAEAIVAREKSKCGDATVVHGLLKAAKQREVEALRTASGGRGGSRSAVASDSRRGRMQAGRNVVSGEGVTAPVSSTFSTVPGNTAGPWKLADIEKAVLLKDDAVAAASRSIAASHRAETSSLPLSRSVLADIDGPDPALWRLRNGHEAVGVSERIESWAWTEDGNDRSFPTTVVQRGFVSKLEPAVEGARDVAKRTGSEAEWPRGVRLRTRLGKRCRKDLAAGRAGILIKATFNPLEGDSSGAKKGGKWFKKDCSAALLVPRLTVIALPVLPGIVDPSAPASAPPGLDAGGHHGESSLVLRIANPQDTLLRVRFANFVDPDRGRGVAYKTADNDTTTRRHGVVSDEALGARGVEDGVSATSSSAGNGRDGGVAASVRVTLRPSFGDSIKQDTDDGWIRLEGKEDEFLRQPGDRHRPPKDVIRAKDGDNGGVGNVAPVLLHQHGDIAWVRIPLGVEAADRVNAAIGEARAETGSGEVIVTVRFLLVMREGDGDQEEKGTEGDTDEKKDVEVPIAVRFTSHTCPP